MRIAAEGDFRGSATWRHWPAIRSALIANPGWVLDDPDLLARLNLRPAAANVVEFGPAALARLETAKAAEASARVEIEALAEANFTAQVETHSAILELLEARNNADLAARADTCGRERFGLACATLCVEGDAAPAGWRALPRGFTGQLLGAAAARLGPSIGGETLFGKDAKAVKSVALLRLTLWNDRPGLLAFGSAEPDGFTPEMGAELVAFLARVVERVADRWPPLL
ncbi:DUF484 family protein [soil metagenome]